MWFVHYLIGICTITLVVSAIIFWFACETDKANKVADRIIAITATIMITSAAVDLVSILLQDSDSYKVSAYQHHLDIRTDLIYDCPIRVNTEESPICTYKWKEYRKDSTRLYEVYQKVIND
jgi:hypothetical protein